MIKINERIFIREDDLVFRFSRSGGPGGQNVNKVNTRVTVFFDVVSCESLSGAAKKRILEELATRASKAGVIRVVSQRHRTQGKNRAAALGRLQELLAAALERRPARKKTAVPYGARQRRLEEKKRRSVVKQQRKKVGFPEQ